MEIIYKHINELKPYERNPRKNETAVASVAKSIQEFGFKNPIIIDKDNVIIAGHTRLLAAKELGLKEVPCIMADDLTEEQVKAFRLADNKLAEIAEWDFELLDAELDELQDIDMEQFGFYSDSLFGDLKENDFVDLKGEANKYSFDVTFTFPIETKEKIMNYIKENTKSMIVDTIIRHVEEARHA